MSTPPPLASIRMSLLRLCPDCGPESSAGEPQHVQAEGGAVAGRDSETAGRADLLEGMEPPGGHGRTCEFRDSQNYVAFNSLQMSSKNIYLKKTLLMLLEKRS